MQSYCCHLRILPTQRLPRLPWGTGRHCQRSQLDWYTTILGTSESTAQIQFGFLELHWIHCECVSILIFHTQSDKYNIFISYLATRFIISCAVECWCLTLTSPCRKLDKTKHFLQADNINFSLHFGAFLFNAKFKKEKVSELHFCFDLSICWREFILT